MATLLLRRGLLARRLVRSVSVLALGAAWPLGAGAEDLKDALVNAYNSNPQLQAERAQLRATDEGVPQALSNWRPTVTVSASAGFDHTESNGTGTTATPLAASNPLAPTLNPILAELASLNSPGTTNTHPTTYGLTVTEPLYRGGRTVAQTSQALNLVRAERAHLVDIEQQIFLAVVTDYMNVVEEQSVVDLNKNNEQVLRRQLEATQDRFKVGEVTRTDVAQAEAAYAAAIAGRRTAEGQLQVFRAAYEHDVGDAPGMLAAPTSVPDLPNARDAATSVAAVAAPSVISAQYAEAAAEDNVRVIRGGLLPTVSVQGSIAHTEDQTSAGVKTDSEQVIAQLSMPIYEGGLIYSETRAAQQTVSQRRSQIDDSRRAAVQASGQAWENLESTRATIKSLQEQVRANEIALEGVRQEASVGSRTVLDILNEEQTLFQSRVNLVQSQRDEVVYEFTLAQSVGRLTSKTLGLPVEYYDPDKNFDLVRDKWVGFGTAE
jgi:outer membrane protein